MQPALLIEIIFALSKNSVSWRIQPTNTLSAISGRNLTGKHLGGWQVPSRGPPVRHCLKCQPHLSTSETRTGYVLHGVGHKTPFLGRGNRNAAEDPRPNMFFPEI